jgi:predicted alpha/beta-hydrolase family hydrolase
MTHREKVVVDAKGSVSVEIATPPGFRAGETPALVLAPGAGSNMANPFLASLAQELSAEFLTARFNFPYQESGRGAPDAQRRLEATYRAVLTWLRAHTELAPGRIVAGGKSMGGRIASHLAAAGEPLAGLIFLGYPLHPPGQPERRRDSHLPAITCPMLFLQGSRDRLCDLDLLRPVLQKLKAPYRLHVIEEGDHSFKVPKRTGRSEADILAEIRDEIRRFVDEVVDRQGPNHR